MQIEYDPADVIELTPLSTLDARYNGVQGGKLFVPPAYMQTSSDAAFQIDSAAKGVAFAFTPECDFALSSFSLYITAVATRGIINCGLYTVNETGAYEKKGLLNGSFTNAAPTMTANNAPSPNVVGLFDSTGANAEAGAGYEAFKAFDNSTAADNGTRSNAAPTAIAPIYLTLDLGEGNGIRLNKVRFYSFNNADANVRAFPKAFTIWGANSSATPAPQTDGDWTEITGDSTWTAETDPGAGLAREYYLNNSTNYRHIRFKFTDRTGANAYMALGSVQLFGAQLGWSPGTAIADLGDLDCGASADAWVRHTFTAQQLQRGKRYCLRFMGEAGDDYSLSYRRWNTAVASMFPDDVQTKETIDTATTWTESQQNTKPACLNIVLNSTTHHCPNLYYGRYVGQYVYITSSGIIQIPEAGVSLDCEGLTASVDHASSTLYNVYLYSNSGTLTLEASTTEPVTTEGILVKSVDTSHRYLGAMCAINRTATYQGPIDVGDARWLDDIYYSGRTVEKLCPYYSSTVTLADPWLYMWKKVNNGDDFKVTFVTAKRRKLTSRFRMTGLAATLCFVLDNKLLEEYASPACSPSDGYNLTSTELRTDVKGKGLHSLWPVHQQRSSGQYFVLYAPITDSQYRYHRSMLSGELV